MDDRRKQWSNHLLVFQMGPWSGRPSPSKGKSPRGRSPGDRLTEQQGAVATELDKTSDTSEPDQLMLFDEAEFEFFWH